MIRPQTGFTILEVVIAASLLLATCIATSGVLSSATRADGAAELGTHLQGVLASECERLAALPFSADDGTANGDSAPMSLVSEAFPFARPELNTDLGYFVDAPGDVDAGTFVSVAVNGPVRIRREAVFASGDGDEQGHLGSADLAGWDCTSVARPPATTLRISVQVSERGQSAARTLVLSALRPTVDPSTPASSS